MRNSKKIPWMLIAVALVFSFNPNIAIIDPLPDFIGYMLLSFVLSRITVLNSTLDDAKRAFDKMILIDGCKILAIMWVFGMEALSERTTSILVWCFAFAVLEGIFLIPAYLKLFRGLSELGDFYSSQAIHEKAPESRLSYTEKIRNLTVAFVAFRAFMTVLPELSVLSNTSTDEIAYSNSLYRYIGVMRGFCVIPVLVFGIIWAVKLVKYFKRLASDTELNSALLEEHNKKFETRRGIFIKGNVKTACWFMLIGSVLTLDIRLEKVNLLPDLLVLVMIMPAFAFFSRDTALEKKKVRVFAVLYGCASVLSHILEAYYVENFTYNAMNKNVTAFVMYLLSVIAVAVQGAMFICLLAVLFKEIKKVIVTHTGFVEGKEIHSEGEDARIAEVHSELDRNFTFAFDAAMLYVISDVVYALYGAFYAFVNVNLGFLNVINLCCGALFIGMLFRAMNEMREAVDTKYMLS